MNKSEYTQIYGVAGIGIYKLGRGVKQPEFLQ